MTNENILDAIGGINEGAVQDAKAYRDTGVHHFRRIPTALIAAIIALLLMGVAAAAAIYGSNIQSWFASQWEALTGQPMSNNQAAIIDHLSQDIGTSQSVENVTASVDSATVGDDCFYLLLRVSGIELSEKRDYGFENFELKIEPDPLTDTSGVGGLGIQYLGLDDDGTALMLFKHECLSQNGAERDSSPLDITLRLTNFIRNKNIKVDKVLAEGTWDFTFTLDRSQFPQIIKLPDTEMQVYNSYKQENMSITITNIELTCTGIHFQYDYHNGELDPLNPITAILENGITVDYSSGSGYVLADDVTLACSYQWRIPINIDEVAAIQIGNTQIDIP